MLLPLLSLALTLPALGRNITVDNVSPQLVFSPRPCFQDNSQGCSDEWQLHENPHAFNGSVTFTTGVDPAVDIAILPRVSLTFQGSDIVFMPGLHSTAQATVVIDNRESVLLDTSTSAFAAEGLDSTQNHTITVMFVPSNETTLLEVDYFFITLPDGVQTSTPTSSFFTTALPTSLPSTTSTPTAVPAPPRSLAQQTIPTGTIAAVSVSGGLVLILGFLVCFCAARRRRRRAALQRERAILYDLHLPSERAPHDSIPWLSYRPASEYRDSGYGAREKGKARESDPLPAEPELEWRIASPPPASLRVGRTHSADYTPWP